MRKYKIVTCPSVTMGVPLLDEDLSEIEKFLNEQLELGYEFVSFFPCGNGIDENVLFRGVECES